MNTIQRNRPLPKVFTLETARNELELSGKDLKADYNLECS
jgi:hypothetical protein